MRSTAASLFLVIILRYALIVDGAAGLPKQNAKEVAAQVVSKNYYQVIEPYVLCNMTSSLPALRKMKFPWNCTIARQNIGSWCSWTGINCDSNGAGIPSNVINTISIPNMGVAGTIPSAIGLLTSLKYLVMNKNSLVGTIPSTIGGLVMLEMIHLDNNFLTGRLPAGLKNLTKLSVLNVNNNYMSGSLDPFFSTKFINDDSVGTPTSYVQVNRPTGQPTGKPTFGYNPSFTPTFRPSQPTSQPTSRPSGPTRTPTRAPTRIPTKSPTVAPSRAPTVMSTLKPSLAPTTAPTVAPSESVAPTTAPTVVVNATIIESSNSESTTTLPAGSIAAAVIMSVFGAACCCYLCYFWVMPNVLDPGGSKVADAK